MSFPQINGSQTRILGFDLARALAVFGMVIVNFKMVMGAEHSGPEWLKVPVGFISGKAAALFVMLAGVGISLMTAKARASHGPQELQRSRTIILKRALFLFVLGLAFVPIWPADILHFYGLYMVGAAYLLKASDRKHLAISLFLVFIYPALLVTLDYNRDWDWSTYSYRDFWSVPGMLRHLLFNGFHPVIPWCAFLLAGMVIGRADLRQSEVRKTVLRWGLLAFGLAQVSSLALRAGIESFASPTEKEDLFALVDTAPMPPTPLYMFCAGGLAAVLICLCVSLALRSEAKTWISPLVATGQLALTIYMAHIVVGMGILESVGKLETQSLEFSLWSALVFFGCSVAFAHLWRKRFARGPLEAVMRRVTQSVAEHRPQH